MTLSEIFVQPANSKVLSALERSGMADEKSYIPLAIDELVPYLSNQSRLDLVITGELHACRAVAGAQNLSTDVCAALAEIGDAKGVLNLIRNHAAAIPTFSLIRIIERFPRNENLFDAMELRREIDFSVWQALATARIEMALCGVLQPISGDDIERAHMDVLANASPIALPFYFHHLLMMQHGTITMLLRAILSQHRHVVCEFLSQISGYSTELVAHVIDPLRLDEFRDLAYASGFTNDQIKITVMALGVLGVRGSQTTKERRVGPCLDCVSRMQRLLAFSHARGDQELRRFMNRLRREAETGVPFPPPSRDVTDFSFPSVADHNAEESRFAA